MKKPAKLQSGDTIGIVAPASSFDKENFKKGIKVLRALGYKVKYEKSIFNKCWSKTGHNKQRGKQINRMFADPEIKVILCAKGGYGSQEIISFVDLEVIKKNPKIFIGYSDITILLLFLHWAADMVVFHGPVVSGEFFKGMNPETIDSFNRLLGSDKPFGKTVSKHLRVLRTGKASGPLVGGNLSLILESIGTPYEIDTENKILFLEEISESADVIVSGLNRLKANKKLDKIRGMIWGRMTNCFDSEGEFIQVIKEFFEDSIYPILYNFPSGHTSDIAQSHLLLPFGINIAIDSDFPNIEITESAVTAL
ncbi:MAG: LD-carboxypeptidase [Candidatus Aceula meridiana]|nr:LD-carboxypeptidase [Candidatus Aceula meridiana]